MGKVAQSRKVLTALLPGIKKVFTEAIDDQLRKLIRLEIDELDYGNVLGLKAIFSYNHKSYGMGVRIDRSLVEDEQYTAITHRVEALAKTMQRSFDKVVMGENPYFFDLEDELGRAIQEAVEELRR
jgi:hypothetical protein